MRPTQEHVMTSLNWQTSWAVGLTIVFASGAVKAQSSVDGEQIGKLQGQIQKLQRELDAMKRKMDAAPEKSFAASTPPTKSPVPAPTAIVKMSPENRPSICTADGR